MTKLKRFLKRWWWAILGVVAALLGIAWKILAPKPQVVPTDSNDEPIVPPTLKEMARTEVEHIKLEAEVEKAAAKAEADVHREELEAIKEEGKKDPVAARKKLAAKFDQLI